MELIDINILEFKNEIYKRYCEYFLEDERKTYDEIKRAMEKGVMNIIKITYENECVGFMIINLLDDNFILLDYFAINQEHRKKGLGTKAINLLKEKYNKCNGIIIEILKEGMGKDKEENFNRTQRANFYKRLGFKKSSLELILYKNIYSIYILIDKIEKINEINLEKILLKSYKDILEGDFSKRVFINLNKQ